MPSSNLKFIDIRNNYVTYGTGTMGSTDISLNGFAGTEIMDQNGVVSTIPNNNISTSLFLGNTFQVAPEFSNLSFTSTINLANTADVGYTLNKPIVSGTITYTRTSGEPDSGSPHTVNLTGSELNQGTFLGELTNAPTLVVDTLYNLTFNGTDSGGNVATPVTLTGTIPFGQFGTNYRIAQYGNYTVQAENGATQSLWNQMRAAYNNSSTVQLRVVDGVPYTENSSYPAPPLSTYQGFTFAQAQINGAGSAGGGGIPNHLDFVDFFGPSFAYQQLHNATFLVKIT